MTLKTIIRNPINFLLGRSNTLPNQKITMVVGMHRSGTSFLTGSLQQAGLELGKHSTWNPHNQRGNRENADIVKLHDDILEARGFAWDKPPTSQIEWTHEENSRAVTIIRDYRKTPHWGFKDPRSALVVEGWQKLIPGLTFVGIFRHPTAVAESLRMRGNMPRELAFGLWLAYNQRLMRLYRQKAFPVLCFDEPEAVLLSKLDNLTQEIGLTPNTAERFFTNELKHHESLDEPLPSPLASLYAELKSIAR